MRLRNYTVALALSCAATGAALAQATAPPPESAKPQAAGAAQTAPRPVEVKLEPLQVGVRTVVPDAPPGAPSGVAVTTSAPEAQFRFTQAQPGQPPAQNRDPEQQRIVELYRAQFGGELTKATYLGVSTSPVPAALRQHLGLPEGVGLVVDFVEPDSPAQSAGIKQYDILKKFNDQILVNAQQLAVLVRSQKAGDEIKLGLIRGGKEQSLSAKLVEHDAKPLEALFFGGSGPGELGVEFEKRALADKVRERRYAEGRADRGNGNGNGASNRNRTVSVWRDNDMTLTIIQNDGGTRQLMVKEKSGAQRMYDLNDPEARNKLPPPIAEKLKQMESKLKPDDKPKTDKPGSNHKPQPGADVNVEKRIESHGDADDESDEETETEVEVREGNRPSARAPISDNDVLNISLNQLHGPGIQTVKLARVRDGQVRVPYIEPVPCAGLTVRELENRIRSKYVESKISPTVNVRVRKVTGASELAAEDGKRP